MTIEETAGLIAKKGLLKREQTAGQIGARIGRSGRGISRSLKALVDCGVAVNHGGRYPTYTKAA